MKIIKAKDYQDMSRKAANIISAQIIMKPDCVLGLATGSTPIGTYDQLIDWYKKGDLDFSQVTTFNLDEYIGLAPEHDQSYHYFMNDNLFNHVNINKENVHVPDGVGFEAGEAGKAYEELMAKTGQVEIQLLGLGCNGHIGFNEPADEFTKVTGEIDLTDSTIEANKRFFEKKEDVPRKAVSMGIGTIMRAKKIVLLVNGENKAEILKEVVNGPVTPKVPGSILQFHPHVTVICDEEAAKYL